MNSEVQQYYGNKIRVRVCGVCINADSLLMVNHSGITSDNFWTPPGGGLNPWETAEDCLIREFFEETGLKIKVNEFLFACEMIKPPLHAIELFFSTKVVGGDLKKGKDPEAGSPQIIKRVSYVAWKTIQSLPDREMHGIFKFLEQPSKIMQLRGYFQVG